MEIRWSEEAVDDLEQIYYRIQRDNLPAAREVVSKIYERVRSLQEFPKRGRKGRISGSRELVLTPLPWIVVYRVRGDAVEISRIYHGAQNWP